MLCKDCPAYWESITPMVGVEDWGCYCEPENGSDCGHELVDGFYGCDRTINDINKVLKNKKEKEKPIWYDEWQKYWDLNICGDATERADALKHK